MEKDVFKSITEMFARINSEERVHIIVKQYFRMMDRKARRGEEIPGSLQEQFTLWLLDPRQRQAKDAAMEQMMTELLS